MSMVAKNCPTLYKRCSTGGKNLSTVDKTCPPVDRFCTLVDKNVNHCGQKLSTKSCNLIGLNN
ncbi:hypothetical protein DPMN_069609 [Dreissena polymorpha]|uniref:Uncharacterized protein n=1 Tax=Dreissena polymorpha TaxID=45954 RepID=A0A9D3Z3L0_DREPO|nr:hypothetical protein DPMN_069609 [Dreissena polymorpha]